MFDELMITATKTNRVLSSLPLNASIITSDQIQNTNANRLSEIINEELGLITVDDFGGVKGIQMQHCCINIYLRIFTVMNEFKAILKKHCLKFNINW